MSSHSQLPERTDSPPPTAEIAVGPSDRVLLLAPHPDDESVAAGGILQAAVAAGAATHICYLTDGENNPWAQRASERRLWITAAAQIAFGSRRRGEALAAMGELGLSGDDATFLGFPDQWLTQILVELDTVVIDALAEIVARWRPTLLVTPSCADLHPDHSALAVLTDIALARLEESLVPARHWAYVVHNPSLRRRTSHPIALSLSQRQQEHKLAAILCHATQLHFRGGWLRTFADRLEPFVEPGWPSGAPHPVTVAGPTADALELALASRSHWRSFGPRRLRLLALPEAGGLVSLTMSLPRRSARLQVSDVPSRHVVGAGSLAGIPGTRRLHLAPGMVPSSSRIWAKIEHRFGFFDEAGWRELSLAPTP